jgi:hypothetical protein
MAETKLGPVAPVFGGFNIIRRKNGYVTWTIGTDIPMLVFLSKSKDVALDTAKKHAKAVVDMSKFLEKDKPIRIGYGVREIPIDQLVKSIDWNDCVGYEEYYV